MTADASVIGKVGRVTGRVARGSVGEVMVGVRGGSEAFFAYPYDAGETIDKGVDHMIVLNGAEGMGGVTGQVLGTGLAVIPMIRVAFANGVNGGRASTSENGEKPAACERAKRTEPKQ